MTYKIVRTTVTWLKEVERLRYLISNLGKPSTTCSLVYSRQDLEKMIGHAKKLDELYYIEALGYSLTYIGYTCYHALLKKFYVSAGNTFNEQAPYFTTLYL